MALMGLGHFSNLEPIFTPQVRHAVSPVVSVLPYKGMNEKDRRRVLKNDWPSSKILQNRFGNLEEVECAEERIGLNLDEHA